MTLKSFLCFTLIGVGSIYIGYQWGSLDVKTEWDKAIIESNQIVLQLKEDFKKKEEHYYEQSIKINSELNALRKEYSDSLSSIKYSYEYKLQQSDNRANIYRNMSEASEVERRRLAEYTAQLDASLTEGISLVRELRETIKLRDNQLKELGNQLIKDRELIN